MSTIDIDALMRILEQLASQANLPNLLQTGPNLPPGWVNLNMFGNSNSYPGSTVPSQGFLAKGPVEGAPGPTGQVAVLALGMTWPNYLVQQTYGTFVKMRLPPEIAGNKAPGDAEIFDAYVYAYRDLRPPIWASLRELGSLPLYICGMTLAGPMAQIAALDLRPGNIGPNGEDAPSTPSPCYAFSTANVANPSMQSYYNTTIPNSTVVRAGTSDLPVDFFPTQPANSDTVPLGSLISLPTGVPAIDVPWLERSDLFYLRALKGVPDPAFPTPTNINNPPAGFSRTLAYTLAKLTVAAYHLTQHPDGTIDTAPYVLKDTINANGQPFGFVFESPDAIAVACRGCTTFAEFNSLTALSIFATPDFNPDGGHNGKVQKGAYTVYSSPVQADTEGPLFSEALRKSVKALLGSKKLYITGHSLGGAIANIAAADYAMGKEKIEVSAIYTYGAIMVANMAFSLDFNARLGPKSYQIRRLNDKIAIATGELGYEPVDNQIILQGDLEYDESTYHSLYGYFELLDPSRGLAKKEKEEKEKKEAAFTDPKKSK